MRCQRLPISITEIICALERDAANTDTDPRWIAATELRRFFQSGNDTVVCLVNLEAETERCAKLAQDHGDFCRSEALNGGHPDLFERAKGAHYLAERIRRPI